jgi:integrase/recombinase XerD
MSKGKSSESVVEGLEVHLAEFLTRLGPAGYATSTEHEKRRLIERFIRWIRDAGFVVSDLDDSCIDAFLGQPPHDGRKPRKMDRATLQQFLGQLRTVGVLPPHCVAESSLADVLVQGYLDHLRGDRGLCERSLEVYLPFVHTFVAVQRLPARVASLDASAVREYLLDRCCNRPVSFVKLLTAALRSFLRFLFFNKETATDLSTAVPSVRRWRLAGVPQYLTPDEVERVIASIDRSTAGGCRAHAMLLLLARLGLRAGEVAILELDDIRWEVGEIVVRGKGRLQDHLPLLDDVGEALACYIREARGPSSSRRVFLRSCAPHGGLSGPTAVCLVARKAIRGAGLLPTGRVGAHVFRHSLATRMIRHGASLAEISKVLRHRSTETTQLYAKVAFEELRGVAMPWPSTEVPR